MGRYLSQPYRFGSIDDPNKLEGNNDTPFNWACYKGNHDCVRVLSALGAQPDHFGSMCRCPDDIPR